MSMAIKDLFIKAALVGASVLPLGALASEPLNTASSPEKSAKNLSVRDASIMIRDANRAADKFLVMGIIGSINAPGKVNMGTTDLSVGLNKAACEDAKNQQSSLIDLDTYKAAQSVLIKSGHLTADKAATSLRTQTKFLEAIKSNAPVINATCEELGVGGVLSAQELRP